jgi:hypothetical protein
MESWQQMPELPTSEELMARTGADIRSFAHDVDHPLEDKERYLETQYRLLRYEGVELLRSSISEFRKDPHMSETDETAIYTKVSELHFVWSLWSLS